MTAEQLASPEWIHALRAPLSDAMPSGPWLRYSESFRLLEKMRINESDDLPLGEWQRPLVRADWGKTAEACQAYLREQSRDLHVAAWLCEALAEAEQLKGLDQGLQALHALVESQWPSLWPAIEDGEVEARVAPFIWINRSLPVCLRRNLVLLEPTLLRQQPIRLDDWLRWPAEDAGSDKSKASIRKLVGPDDRAALQTLRAFSIRSREHLNKIEHLLDEHLGAEAPGFGALKQLLDTIAETAQSLGLEPAAAPKDKVATNTVSATPSGALPAPGSLAAKPTNREEALALLNAAVESLQRHDPHSPATLLAARAALWGGLSLQQMAQFEASQGRSLGTTLELLGVPLQAQT
jgi:type VI secretion system protein ImpA